MQTPMGSSDTALLSFNVGKKRGGGLTQCPGRFAPEQIQYQ